MTTGQRIVLILLALCVMAGMATGGKMYYRLAYLWGFLYFGGLIWSRLTLWRLYFNRSARTLRAQVGQIFEERFEIHNLSWLPRIWIEVHDETQLPGSEGSRIITMINGKQARYYLARTRLVKRGVFPLGPTTLTSGDLFGLFPSSKKFAAQDSLLIYPHMFEIVNFPNPPGLLTGGEALRRRTHQITPNAAGIREYEPGDPLNRIHWVSTARRSRLMVKEFELDPLADIWIFFDADRTVHAALDNPADQPTQVDVWQKPGKIELPPSTEEYGVSIAASLARSYLRKGRAVGLVSVGKYQTLLSPDRGGRQLGKILEALALLTAEGNITLRGLVETQVKHMSRGSTVVLITPSTIREIAIIVDYLLQRGLRPIVVLLDSASFGGMAGSQDLEFMIKAMGVPVRLVKNGVNLELALAEEGLPTSGGRNLFV